MMFPSDTSLVEEVEADVDRADQDGVRRVEGAESICHDLN